MGFKNCLENSQHFEEPTKEIGLAIYVKFYQALGISTCHY
jgi:hypothetical protein